MEQGQGLLGLWVGHIRLAAPEGHRIHHPKLDQQLVNHIHPQLELEGIRMSHLLEHRTGLVFLRQFEQMPVVLPMYRDNHQELEQ